MKLLALFTSDRICWSAAGAGWCLDDQVATRVDDRLADGEDATATTELKINKKSTQNLAPALELC
jgi:hypothetical protein